MTPVAFVPALYLSTCLIATAVLVTTGSAKLFWPAHLLVIATVAVTAIGVWRKNLLLRSVPRDAGAICLYAFIAYYVIRAASHDVEDVSRDYLKAFAANVAAGVILGYLAFSDIGKRALGYEARVWFIATIFIGFASICFVSILYYSSLRYDVFLIHVPVWGGYYYQIFGDYLSMLFILVLYAAYRLFDRHHSVFSNVLFSFFASILTFGVMFLSQAPGSNKAVLLVGLIGASSMLSRFFDMARVRPSGWLSSVMLSVCIGFFSVVAAWSIAADQPPMRVFSFQAIPAPPLPEWGVGSFVISLLSGGREASPSGSSEPIDMGDIEEVESELSMREVGGSSRNNRGIIWKEYAIQQLSINPVFGDLASDRIVTRERGNYLHSLASVQTHLGVVGSVLIVVYLLSRIVMLLRMRLCPILNSSFVIIVIVAAGTSFFTWYPFWFVVGAMLAPREFPLKSSGSRRRPLADNIPAAESSDYLR